MATFEDKVEAIKSAIANDWNERDRVYAWREYCNHNDMDDMIYFMDELDDCFGERKLTDFLGILDDSFNLHSDFFAIDCYGHIKTGDYADDFDCYDEDALAEYIAENGQSNFPVIYDDSILDEFLACFVDEYSEDEIIEFLDSNAIDLLVEDWEDITERLDEYFNAK